MWLACVPDFACGRDLPTHTPLFSQGVIVFAGVLFVIWRFTQRRFSDLDDGGDDIKWPELQPDGQTTAANTSTLNPMGTRRTGGAGIEMDGDGKDESDAYAGSMYYSQEHATGSYEQVGVYGNQGGPGGAYCASHFLRCEWLGA